MNQTNLKSTTTGRFIKEVMFSKVPNYCLSGNRIPSSICMYISYKDTAFITQEHIDCEMIGNSFSHKTQCYSMVITI